MKKTLLLGLSVLLIAGCSDAVAGISDSKSTIMNVAGTEVTKQDLYDIYKESANSEFVLGLVQNKILDIEVPITDELKEEANAKLAETKEKSGESFDMMLQIYGFKSEEDFLNKNIMNALRLQKLTEKQLSNLSDEDIEGKYFPRKAKIFTTKEEQKATDALNALKDGKDFTEVCEEFGTTTTFSGEEQVVTSETALPALVFDTIKTRQENGVYLEIIEDTTNGEYYLFEVTNYDFASFKDEAMAALATLEDVQKGVIEGKYKEYEMSFHDIDIYNLIKESNASYLE